jgi:hypothetical protein
MADKVLAHLLAEVDLALAEVAVEVAVEVLVPTTIHSKPQPR